MGDLPLPERAREHGVHADEHQAGLAVVPDDAPRPEAVPTLDVHGAAAVGEGPFHDRPRGHHVRAALPPLHPGDETRAVPSAHPLDDVDAALGPRGQPRLARTSRPTVDSEGETGSAAARIPLPGDSSPVQAADARR